jgi:phosphoserine phosphatase RsbU/P
MDSLTSGYRQLVPADLVRLQTEMDLAQQVQLGLLPKSFPPIPGLDLSVFSQPASHVGGDFYDFVVGPGPLLTFFVGDVSGKGVPAAMLMTMTRIILRAEAGSPMALSPEAILQNANARLLADFLQLDMFVTIFVSQYHPASRELVFANAGHSPVIFRPAHGIPQVLEAAGPALGLLETCRYKNHRLCLAEGDLLIIATDGLYEVRNARNVRFGLSRLLKEVQRLNDPSALEVSDTLLGAVRRFSHCETPVDDQTILILRCTGQTTS